MTKQNKSTPTSYTTEYNESGGVRFNHELKIGMHVVYRSIVGTEEKGVIVDDGMAGMPEVAAPDGHTFFLCPQDIISVSPAIEEQK